MKLSKAVVLLFAIAALLFSVINLSVFYPIYENVSNICAEYNYDVQLYKNVSSEQMSEFLYKLDDITGYSVAVLSGHLDSSYTTQYGFRVGNMQYVYGVSENFAISPYLNGVDVFGVEAYENNELVCTGAHTRESIQDGTAVLHNNGNSYTVVAQNSSGINYVPLSSFLSVNQDISYFYLQLEQNPFLKVFQINSLLRSEFDSSEISLGSCNYRSRMNVIYTAIVLVGMLCALITVIIVKALKNHIYTIDRWIRSKGIKKVRIALLALLFAAFIFATLPAILLALTPIVTLNLLAVLLYFVVAVITSVISACVLI